MNCTEEKLNKKYNVFIQVGNYLSLNCLCLNVEFTVKQSCQ